MSLPFAIEQRLSHAHLAAFHEFILDRGVTVDVAGDWLLKRGYRISHAAIHRYIRRARASGIFSLRRSVGLRDDAATRRQLAVWTEELSGDALSNLALFAVYLMQIEAARRGVRMTEIPGTVQMRSKDDRTAK